MTINFKNLGHSWQVVSKALEYKCRVDDNGFIVVKSEFKDSFSLPTLEELLVRIDKVLVETSIQEKGKEIEKHIYSSYPQSKQNSDLADKMFYETTLKATGNYPTLEALITTAIADFYTAQTSGNPVTTASLAQPLAVTAGDEIGIEQLIKVGIRVKWVQDCKAAYAQAVANIQAGNEGKLTLPKYPL